MAKADPRYQEPSNAHKSVDNAKSSNITWGEGMRERERHVHCGLQILMMICFGNLHVVNHATVNSEDSQRQRLRTGESSLRSFTFSTSSLFVVKWSLHSCVRLNRFHVTKMRRPILRGEGGGQE